MKSREDFAVEQSVLGVFSNAGKFRKSDQKKFEMSRKIQAIREKNPERFYEYKKKVLIQKKIFSLRIYIFCPHFLSKNYGTDSPNFLQSIHVRILFASFHLANKK